MVDGKDNQSHANPRRLKTVLVAWPTTAFTRIWAIKNRWISTRIRPTELLDHTWQVLRKDTRVLLLGAFTIVFIFAIIEFTFGAIYEVIYSPQHVSLDVSLNNHTVAAPAQTTTIAITLDEFALRSETLSGSATVIITPSMAIICSNTTTPNTMGEVWSCDRDTNQLIPKSVRLNLLPRYKPLPPRPPLPPSANGISTLLSLIAAGRDSWTPNEILTEGGSKGLIKIEYAPSSDNPIGNITTIPNSPNRIGQYEIQTKFKGEALLSWQAHTERSVLWYPFDRHLLILNPHLEDVDPKATEAELPYNKVALDFRIANFMMVFRPSPPESAAEGQWEIILERPIILRGLAAALAAGCVIFLIHIMTTQDISGQLWQVIGLLAALWGARNILVTNMPVFPIALDYLTLAVYVVALALLIVKRLTNAPSKHRGR